MPIASYSLEVKPVSTWVAVAAGSVLNVSGSWETSGNDQNGIAFGSDTDATITADLLLSEWANTGHMIPIRYTTTMDADTTRTFTGVITKRSRNLDSMTVDAEGIKTLIAATKGYSPAFARRPVATKTTASSVDDTSNAGYKGGLINWMLWTSGGRPYEQSGTYPTATFYYSCDHALLAPDWSWAAGEDAWSECLRLAKDSGGQMYQDANGVVRYRQVMGYGSETASETLTASDYATVEEVTDPGKVYATKITCQYVPRRRLGQQLVVDDTTPRHVENGETATIVVEPQNPIASLDTATSTQLKADSLVVAQLDGTRVAQGASGYTHTLDIKAARVTITITNASGKPFTVWRVKLTGDPIVASEAGSISAGSGTVERVLEQSPYIQSRSAAQRIAEMTLAFYAAARPTVTVSGCVHKPNRAIGTAINVTVSEWSMTAQRHVILSIDHDQTGIEAGYTLADVSDLPTSDQFFILGTTYTSGQNKFLGW
jgi:hypothetical protein